MAENEKEKVSVKIFPSLNGAGEAYIAGPITVHDSVNNLTELYAKSDEIVAASGVKHPVVFVANVLPATEEGYPDTARSAYYIFDRNDSKPIWREIALGPQIDNLDFLAAIDELDMSRSGYLKITNENGIIRSYLIDAHNVPELPDYIKEQGKYYEESATPELPDDVWYHLDAKLDELGLNGDINSPDHVHDVAGSCQELYELLYLNSNSRIRIEYINNAPDAASIENNIRFIIGQATSKDQTVYLKDQMVEFGPAISDPINSAFYVINFDTDLSLSANDIQYEPKKDYLLFALNEKFVNPNHYILSNGYDPQTGKNIATIRIRKEYVEKFLDFGNPLLASILIIKNRGDNPIPEETIIWNMELPDTCISFTQLKSLMYQLYVINRAKHLTNIEYVYLTNDAQGNMVWGNRFVPETNYQMYEHIFTYPKDDISNVKIIGDKQIEINLGHVDVADDSQLLVFFDDLCVTRPSIARHDGNLYLTIPMSNYWDPPAEASEDKYFIIRILFVTKAAVDVINHLAKDYITKRDAVNILSRGKINLDDYPTKKDIAGLALIGHTHGGYAPVNHSHDARYAGAYHNHPEMLTQIEMLNSLKNMGLIGSQVLEASYPLINLATNDSDAYRKLKPYNIDKGNRYLYPIDGVEYYKYTPGPVDGNTRPYTPITVDKDKIVLLKPIDEAKLAEKNTTGKVQYIYIEGEDGFNSRPSGNVENDAYYGYVGPTTTTDDDENLYDGEHFYIDKDEDGNDIFVAFEKPEIVEPEPEPDTPESDEFLPSEEEQGVEELEVDIDPSTEPKEDGEDKSDDENEPEEPELSEPDLPEPPKRVEYYKRRGEGAPLWEDNDVYIFTRVMANIPGDDDISGIVDNVFETYNKKIKSDILAGFKDLGIEVDDEKQEVTSKISTITSAQVQVDETVPTGGFDLNTSLTKVYNLANANKDAVDINIAPLTSEVVIGGVGENETMPTNLQDFLKALVSNKDSALKYVPSKLNVKFAYRDVIDHDTVMWREITALEATSGTQRDVYCKTELIDKFGNHVCSYGYDVKCNDIPLRSDENLWYNLSNLGIIDGAKDKYDLHFEAVSISEELEFVDGRLITDKVLKVVYPTVIYLSTSNNTDDFALSDYTVSYSFEVPVLHDIYEKCLVIGIRDDLDKDFVMQDVEYGDTLTSILDEMGKYDATNELNAKSTIEYKLYSLDTPDTKLLGLRGVKLRYKVMVEEN